MYTPPEFLVTDVKVLQEFITKHAFGSLLVNGNSGYPLIAQMPFVVKENDTELYLEFHLAKQNGILELLQHGTLARVLVNGAHGYISSSVYSHENVPTYNYATVTITGSVERLSQEALLIHLNELVANFEKNRAKPLKFEDWSKELINAYLPDIVGVRLKVFKLDGSFKLSQNRNEVDMQNILHDIQTTNPELHEQMKNVCPRK